MPDLEGYEDIQSGNNQDSGNTGNNQELGNNQEPENNQESGNTGNNQEPENNQDSGNIDNNQEPENNNSNDNDQNPLISDDYPDQEIPSAINFEVMRDQANKAFVLLGNEKPLDTWENVRDVLFEYGKVKYKMTKPIVLEALVDRMIKDENNVKSAALITRTDGSEELAVADGVVHDGRAINAYATDSGRAYYIAKP